MNSDSYQNEIHQELERKRIELAKSRKKLSVLKRISELKKTVGIENIKLKSSKLKWVPYSSDTSSAEDSPVSSARGDNRVNYSKYSPNTEFLSVCHNFSSAGTSNKANKSECCLGKDHVKSEYSNPKPICSVRNTRPESKNNEVKSEEKFGHHLKQDKSRDDKTYNFRKRKSSCDGPRDLSSYLNHRPSSGEPRRIFAAFWQLINLALKEPVSSFELPQSELRKETQEIESVSSNKSSSAFNTSITCDLQTKLDVCKTNHSSRFGQLKLVPTVTSNRDAKNSTSGNKVSIEDLSTLDSSDMKDAEPKSSDVCNYYNINKIVKTSKTGECDVEDSSFKVKSKGYHCVEFVQSEVLPPSIPKDLGVKNISATHCPKSVISKKGVNKNDKNSFCNSETKVTETVDAATCSLSKTFVHDILRCDSASELKNINTKKSSEIREVVEKEHIHLQSQDLTFHNDKDSILNCSKITGKSNCNNSSFLKKQEPLELKESGLLPEKLKDEFLESISCDKTCSSKLFKSGSEDLGETESCLIFKKECEGKLTSSCENSDTSSGCYFPDQCLLFNKDSGSATNRESSNRESNLCKEEVTAKPVSNSEKSAGGFRQSDSASCSQSQNDSVFKTDCDDDTSSNGKNQQPHDSLHVAQKSKKYINLESAPLFDSQFEDELTDSQIDDCSRNDDVPGGDSSLVACDHETEETVAVVTHNGEETVQYITQRKHHLDLVLNEKFVASSTSHSDAAPSENYLKPICKLKNLSNKAILTIHPIILLHKCFLVTIQERSIGIWKQDEAWTLHFCHNLPNDLSGEVCVLHQDVCTFVLCHSSENLSCVVSYCFDVKTEDVKEGLLDLSIDFKRKSSAELLFLTPLPSGQLASATLVMGSTKVRVHRINDDGKSVSASSRLVGKCSVALCSLINVEHLNDIVLGASTNTLYLWDYKNCELIRKVFLEPNVLHKPFSVAWASSERGLLFFLAYTVKKKSEGPCLFVTNPSTGKSDCLHIYSWPQEPSPRENSLVHAPCISNPYIGFISQKTEIGVWNLFTGNLQMHLTSSSVTCIKLFGSKEKYIAVGLRNGDVLLFTPM